MVKTSAAARVVAAAKPRPQPAKAAAAAIPVSRSGYPEYEPKDLPSYQDFDELDGLDEEVADLKVLTERKAALDAQIADKKAAIQSMMEALPQAAESFSVRVTETVGVSYIKATKQREKLVRELLILAGVSEKQLKKGTKFDPPNKPYVQLLLPRKSKAGAGEEE